MSKNTELIAGEYYHIYNRGNNGVDLFYEERNYRYFLMLYKRYIFPVAKTYAYCLMKNHFHLLIQLREGDNNKAHSLAFANLFSTYTKSLNKNYQRTGSLFEKPFKRILIDSDRYFIHLISYIHRNPQKHGFVENFRDYSYSSYQAISQQKNSNIEVEQALKWFGTSTQFEKYHQQFDEVTIQHLIKGDVL